MGLSQNKDKGKIMNKFDQLVQDLLDGKLSLNQMQMAIRAFVRQRDDLPEGIKDLLCGRGEASAGLIYKMYKPIQEAIGSMEMAYRRGKDFSNDS
jgi:hypothetical protein